MLKRKQEVLTKGRLVEGVEGGGSQVASGNERASKDAAHVMLQKSNTAQENISLNTGCGFSWSNI